jgi:hypothetical protein
MGPTALRPSEGSRAMDFYRLKNPSSSAGFEPTNLGSNDKHTTTIPPRVTCLLLLLFCYFDYCHISNLQKLDC